MAQGRELVFTGNAQAAWLIRPGADKEGLTILVKPIGKQWKWVAGGLAGKAIAACAVEDRLHVFLRGGGHLVYDFTGAAPVGRDLKPAPLGVCEGVGVEPGGGTTCLAIVPRAAATLKAPGTPASATTGPEPPPAMDRKDGPHAGDSGVTVLWYDGSEWPALTQVPLPAGVRGPLQATVVRSPAGNTLHVMVPGANGQPNRLLAWRVGAAWEEIPLEGLVREGRSLALMDLQGGLTVALLVRSGDEAWRNVQLARLDGESREFTYQSVLSKDSAAVWAKDKPPLAARLGEKAAFLWREDETVRFAAADAAGRLGEGETVEVKSRKDQFGGQVVIEYFMWVVLGCVLLSMILMHPKGRIGPLALPEQMRPGALPKRLAAWLIDFAPFVFLASLSFSMAHPELLAGRNLSEKLELAKELSGTKEMAWTFIGTYSAHAVYCMLMEVRFGATLGKMLMRLRVVGDGGIKPHLRDILLRNLMRIFETVPMVLLPLLWLIPVMTRKRQRLGDIFARTAVIDISFVPPGPLGPSGPTDEHTQQEEADDKPPEPPPDREQQ